MSTTRIWMLKKKNSCISIRFQSFRATSRRVRLNISKWVNSEVDLVEAPRNPRSVHILPPQLGDNYVVRCCETREYRTSNCVLVFSLWLSLVGSLFLLLGEIQRDNVNFSLIWILFWIIYSRMSKFKRGICFMSFSALQKAPLWNRQTREIGPVSWRFKVLDENSQPDQIQCCCAHQEKGTSHLNRPPSSWHTAQHSLSLALNSQCFLSSFSFSSVAQFFYCVLPLTPVSPCLPGQGEQGERTPREAAPRWAVQSIHGLRLFLL